MRRGGHRGLRSAALFAALPDELPTRPLFDWLRGEGARALLPRVVASPGGSRLEFAEVRAWEELAPGRYGLREPPRASSDLGLSAVDLIVVPGLAFDADGGRLGRGRGMYDQALGALDASTRAPVFGWAYTFQVVDAVPCGRHDQRVDGVITESGLHRAGRAGVEAERHDERRKDDER